jgi:hypothetical protein
MTQPQDTVANASRLAFLVITVVAAQSLFSVFSSADDFPFKRTYPATALGEPSFPERPANP